MVVFIMENFIKMLKTFFNTMLISFYLQPDFIQKIYILTQKTEYLTS